MEASDPAIGSADTVQSYAKQQLGVKSQETLLGVILNKITDKRDIGTKDNPADIGNRGCWADQRSTKWLEGPEWLSSPDNWPA